MQQPFYDPHKSYYQNFDEGPFGLFQETSVLKRDGQPSYQFLGHSLYTPFGIPAGPLLNGKFVAAAFKHGFDLCTYKTVRTTKYPCHPAPNVLAVQVEGDLTLQKAQQPLVARDDYQEPLSITNSFGVPSMDPDWWQPDMAQAVQTAGPGQVMIGSFQGTRQAQGGAEAFVQDYALAAKLVKETGAPILEANLSCPNEGTSDLVCFDIERVQQIATAIKEEIGDTPLILKLAYFESDDHLTELIKTVAPIVDGFGVINTIPAAIINDQGEQALPGEGRLVSGICGTAIKWAGLEMVARLKKMKKTLGHDFVIIGVGGVTQASDVSEYVSQGADAVQSATGSMWHPDLGQHVYELVRKGTL